MWWQKNKNKVLYALCTYLNLFYLDFLIMQPVINRIKPYLCISRMLEVEHPAAKVLVELAALQDEEVGDGTTSVVIIAAELLKVKLASR